MESNATAFRAAYNGPEEDRNELSGYEQCVCKPRGRGREKGRKPIQKQRKKESRGVCSRLNGTLRKLRVRAGKE